MAYTNSQLCNIQRVAGKEVGVTSMAVLHVLYNQASPTMGAKHTSQSCSSDVIVTVSQLVCNLPLGNKTSFYWLVCSVNKTEHQMCEKGLCRVRTSTPPSHESQYAIVLSIDYPGRNVY